MFDAQSEDGIQAEQCANTDDSGRATGALAEVIRLTGFLEGAFKEAEREFSSGMLDMNSYVAVSEHLQRVVDDFYSKYP